MCLEFTITIFFKFQMNKLTFMVHGQFFWSCSSRGGLVPIYIFFIITFLFAFMFVILFMFVFMLTFLFMILLFFTLLFVLFALLFVILLLFVVFQGSLAHVHGFFLCMVEQEGANNTQEGDAYFHHLLSNELVLSRLLVMVLCLRVHFHFYCLWFLSMFIVFTICLDVVHGLVVGKCGNKFFLKKQEM